MTRILKFLNWNIEIISQLILVFSMAYIYGIVEARYIPTDTMSLPLFGRWSYYHLYLLAMMTITSFAIGWLHIQEILTHRKKYLLLMCGASLPLALMIEDVSWFLTKWQPIKQNEWTVFPTGWAIPLGFTWIPVWYLVVTAGVVVCFWLANKYAERGYRAYRNLQEK